MTTAINSIPPPIPEGQRHPTIKQLEWVADFSRYYSGGRGIVDSREYYELVYFEPLEEFLYEALERKYYPKMDARNISVCVSVWIYAHSVETPTHERVSDRILWTESYDMGAEVIRGRTKPEAAIQETFERGFISYKTTEDDSHQTYIALRQDIEKFLSELVDKECADADAKIISEHGIQAIEELNEIHRKNQAEWWGR